MKINFSKSALRIVLFFVMMVPCVCHAQFLDEFDRHDIEGWFFFTGDGDASMDFVQKDGFARISVDATEDRFNVWWAVIKRDISDDLDLSLLSKPGYELRVEARVRVSHAPRRLNFMINTDRTTDFYRQLIEHDIPDNTNWHTIGFTTKDLDAGPDDSLFVQLGVTDWGPDTYHVDLDYYRADIVYVDEAGPDAGEPLKYHPPVPDLDTFAHKLPVTHDGLINLDFPEVNFSNWKTGDTRVLSVYASQWAVLRWDFGDHAGAEAEGAGILEVTTHSVSRGGRYVEAYGEDLGVEFGKIRVIEILGGEADWDTETLSYNRLTQGLPYAEVFNTQMIIDLALNETPGGKTSITLSRPVMQRLLDGTTKGLLIRPLGAINPVILAKDPEASQAGARLFFNTRD
ncbi:hypothetical protein QA596_10070 [Balneolales bacterium ANBcel1]|nr:hypothetical protein [Balneolales bacterium ANBcel1]